MVRLECTKSSWGAVTDPETGELIQLDSDVPQDIATRLVEAFPELSLARESAPEEPEPEEEEEEPEAPTNDEGEYLCVGKTDGQCNRTVDEPFGSCWQHQE